MDVHHRWELRLCPVGKTKHRRHARRFSIECADEKSNVPEHAAVLPPFADDFRFERVLARVEVRPKFLHRLRHRLGTDDELRPKKRRNGEH